MSNISDESDKIIEDVLNNDTTVKDVRTLVNAVCDVEGIEVNEETLKGILAGFRIAGLSTEGDSDTPHILILREAIVRHLLPDVTDK